MILFCNDCKLFFKPESHSGGCSSRHFTRSHNFIVYINDIPTSQHCNNVAAVADIINIVSVFDKVATT